MKKARFHQNEQGSAILIVLGILTLVLVLALVFVATSRNDRAISMANADYAKAGLLAESAVARAESITHYLQKESLDYLPLHAANSDLEYHWMPYAGSFPIDPHLTEYTPDWNSNESTHLPIKIQHFRGYESTAAENKYKNQYLFYTHDSYNKQGADNRPYRLLASTNYGKYLDVSTTNFSGNFNKEKGANNFGYRNILDSDDGLVPVVQGRYAFALLPEGTKFNVNQMAMAKDSGSDNFVPHVEDGVIKVEASSPGTLFNQVKESTFAIAGYTYDSDGIPNGLADGGKYDEAATLQYGLHPQELRVAEDVIELADNLKLGDSNCPPQWFNYDNLLALNKDLWKNGDKPLRDFYSLYTLYSGLDDREVVFHGRLDETIDSCSADSPKINLAYLGKPDSTTRKTWNELSVELKSNPGYLQSNYESVFGEALNDDAGGTLFKDDAGNDITDQVFANLVDFCDSDNAVTYDATVGTPRLEYGSAIDYDDILNVNFCGNEKTPAVIGVGLEFTGVDRNATNGSGTWSVTGDGRTSYRVRVVLQNYFNESVDLPDKVRVVIRGKINPWYAGYYNNAGTNVYQFHGCTHSEVLTQGYAPLHSNPPTFDFSLDAKTFVIDEAVTLTTGTLGGRGVDDTTVDISGVFDLNLSPATNVLGKLERSGIWLQITDILVMTAKETVPGTGINAVMDLAYTDAGNHTILWTKNQARIVLPWAQYRPLAWAIAQDPRVNHKDWRWFDTLEKSGYNWTADATIGIATSAAFGMQDKLRAAALKYIQNTCKNENLTTAKDLEPTLDLTTGANGTGVVQTKSTFSTAFIPNHPFTSLWQLGAVSRGVPAQTVNLKKYGGPKGGQKFADGDAWLLDYFKLNEVAPDKSFPGKFNPNCFNALSYRYLLANIPVNVDLVPADSTLPVDDDNPDPAWIYQPGRLDVDNVARIYFSHYNWFANPGDKVVDFENRFFNFTPEMDFEADSTTSHIAPRQAEKQSWSPVEAFYNFVQFKAPPKYRVATVQTNGTLSSWSTEKIANDRMAEALIGCTAGLLSTRYEYFTVFAIGQNVKYLGKLTLPVNNVAKQAYLAQLVNPVEIKTGASDETKSWYSVLATQMRLMTIERDCWFNTMKVVRTQLY